MKKSFLLFLVLAALLLAHGASTWAETPVVIELFTSEGCSSCPPADALLVDLSRKDPPSGVKLILLGEHVDYWDHIGWKDRFSSSAFSDRQDNYARHLHLATVYTPQLVIDGHLQLGGNRTVDIYRDISQAATDSKPARVSLHWESQQELHVTVQAPAGERPKVLLAITEDGLSTAVKAGENGGRTLHHAAVVRQLRELGTASNGQFEASVNIATHPDWNAAKLKVIVLVQQPNGGKILGAESVDYLTN